MPFQFKFEHPPAGVALTDSREGETATIAFREFTSTEDGHIFIRRVEGFVDDILSRAPTRINPASVDHLLAIISSDGSTTVYVNELRLSQLTRVGRPLEAGEIVYHNDVVDIERLKLGIPIPEDAGVLFLFSVRWRKGLFFDFGPVGAPPREPRTYDLEVLLGQYYALVFRQEIFRLTEDEWAKLLAAQWFPFAALKKDTVESLVTHIRASWDPDVTLISQITLELAEKAPSLLAAWGEHPCFSPHMPILTTAIERFLAKDFVSCTTAIFPRIEGLIRTHMQLQSSPDRPTASTMSRSSVDSKRDRDYSLLLPHRFESYLRKVYFADFDPASPSIAVSRHSVAHGVANADLFTAKAAILGILVIHQLFYFFPKSPSAAT